MNFKINPLSFTGIFPVPNVLVDENIRLASVVQLKTVLYLLRHGNENDITPQKIADALMLSVEDVTDALIFWTERGIVIKDGQAPSPVAVSAPVPVAAVPTATETTNITLVKKEEAVTEPAKKSVPDLDIPRPSHEQVALRLKECEELSTLFQEAQAILGKTIGYEGQAALIMMHDGYGLPIEVILMAVQYSVDRKKTGYSQIAKIGKLWSENEINTIEAVDEFISEHTVVDETWEKLRSLTEITNRNPTVKQRRYLTAWVKEYGYNADMLFYAYEESIDRTGKMNIEYMDKIIQNWYKSGVKTPTDIAKVQSEWKEKNKKSSPSQKNKAPGNSREATYDLDQFMKKATDLKNIKI